MEHVDLVQNEWLAGLQHVVAQAWVEASDVHVEASSPTFAEIIRRPFRDPDTGGLMYAEKEPDTFLRGLEKAFHGSYLFATALHDVASCPYGEHFVLPLEVAERQFS
jgi:hypothetical protein